jgi:hypothetical protein
MPINDIFANKLTVFLFGRRSALRLKFDYSNIPVLSADRSLLMQQYNSINFLTANEKRKIFGFEEVNEPGADELYPITMTNNELGATGI